MNRSFELRTSMLDVGERQQRLVDVGRQAGAAVNSAGSGGSVVGLAPSPDALHEVLDAHAEAGFTALALV